jgi:hypothetical protein
MLVGPLQLARCTGEIFRRKAVTMGDEILGPIDLLAVEFPRGEITGEGFELLLDLIERGIIRVLDLEFVAKAADGSVTKIDLSKVEHSSDVDITKWEGAASGLLDQSDIAEVASAIQPGSLAGILVYENVWAVPLMTALDRSNARLVGYDRIGGEDLMAALNATEPA